MISPEIRTDLALEAHESIQQKNKQKGGKSISEIHGIEVTENTNPESNTKITHVRVTTQNGARAIGKPMGTYITIEAPDMAEPDEGFHREISNELATQLRQLMPKESPLSVLVIGLGNRAVTADALGPNVVDNLCITRHIIKEFGTAAYNRDTMNEVSSLSPGVMAQNGMETAEIIKGVVAQTLPDVVIIIDALAARSTKRMNTTIQLTNTGIQPGSGVGNNRNEISEKSLGIPVIAIGVPTVVDAATIVRSALESLPAGSDDPTFPDFDNPAVLNVFHNLNNMYVTNKDIDATIKRLSFTISEALNMVLVS